MADDIPGWVSIGTRVRNKTYPEQNRVIENITEDFSNSRTGETLKRKLKRDDCLWFTSGHWCLVEYLTINYEPIVNKNKDCQHCYG